MLARYVPNFQESRFVFFGVVGYNSCKQERENQWDREAGVFVQQCVNGNESKSRIDKSLLFKAMTTEYRTFL